MPKLLFIDSSYNFMEISKRNSINVILARDLNSYFDRVISVHPVANLTNNQLFLDNSYYKKNIIMWCHESLLNEKEQNATGKLCDFIFK